MASGYVASFGIMIQKYGPPISDGQTSILGATGASQPIFQSTSEATFKKS